MSLLVLTITVLPVQSRKLLFFFFSFISLFSDIITSVSVQQFLENYVKKTFDSCEPCSIAPPRPPPLSGSFLPIIKLINIVNL